MGERGKREVMDGRRMGEANDRHDGVCAKMWGERVGEVCMRRRVRCMCEGWNEKGMGKVDL